ncbi:tRNA lysidine(34) synthetase TilS [Sphingosinicella soli]|uniref:tRNA(Ile)-lysidine synthase n=1 Tax=Sphingosinicella soli TaxID=333708 RepID=A0A7W7AZ59_9SPHN|nr:tRNA lysidine(34) synthetase TilS [Sphingosinicella soli]MBB4631059.1 tRNA(Ile)-lysidine synthase [Sphingosinicella soli]
MPARQRAAAEAGLTPERFRASVAALAPDVGGRVALAVSGGPDSLALLLLAHRAGFDAAALTVDHGLRPEAADEARHVAAICAGFGVPHVTLAVDVPRAASVQAAARGARYAAMADWCDFHGVPWLMTAHHGDDQAETLLMRLSRGSGLGGMAGIRARRAVEGHAVTLLRPLLGARKADLVALVEAAGLVAIDDPSNRSEAYDRTGARAMLAGGGIDAGGAAATAAHLAEAEAALEWTAQEAWAGRARATGDTIAVDTRGLPAELVRRLVLRAFREIRGVEPDGPALQRLLAGQGGTLGGVRAEGGPLWRFRPEPPRKMRASTQIGTE